MREFHVGNKAEQIVAVAFGKRVGFFEVRAEQDLGARPHPHQLVGHVESFLNHAPRLRDQFGVDHREKRGVVTDVVFHHQHNRNTHGGSVVLHVALVLDVFDDGDQNARVALPQENPLDIRDRIARHEILYFAIVVGQHDHRHVQPRGFDFPRQLRRIHVADCKIGDNQIEAWLGPRQRQSLRSNWKHA